MSMKLEPDPRKWSPDAKVLGRTFLQVFPVVSAIAGGVWYIGSGVYSVAATQTRMLDKIEIMQTQLGETKTSLQDENKQRIGAFDSLKNEVVPRIDTLERAVHSAENEATAVRTRAEDMKKTLDRLEDLALQNLSVSKSHSADIKATRDAVTKDGLP
jgi:hypothetical protein